MHKINDAIVHDGKIVLSQLPFPDGHHVNVVVTEIETAKPRMTISEIRALLHGKVERFDDPTAPMIPEDSWEMHK